MDLGAADSTGKFQPAAALQATRRVAGVRGSGFRLEAGEEPVANLLPAQQQPLYEQVPIFFAARARTGQANR